MLHAILDAYSLMSQNSKFSGRRQVHKYQALVSNMKKFYGKKEEKGNISILGIDRGRLQGRGHIERW